MTKSIFIMTYHVIYSTVPQSPRGVEKVNKPCGATPLKPAYGTNFYLSAAVKSVKTVERILLPLELKLPLKAKESSLVRRYDMRGKQKSPQYKFFRMPLLWI